MKASSSKLVLYTFDHSGWVKTALLALSELGYHKDSILLKEVISLEGVEHCPEFFSLNPLATVPTLVFGDEVLVECAPVTSWLMAHAPNRVAKRRPSKANRIISAVHDPSVDINMAFLAARDHEELNMRAKGLPGLFVTTRQPTLEKYAAIAPPEFSDVYRQRLELNAFLSALYAPNAPDAITGPWFEMSSRMWQNINEFILRTLPAFIPNGSFISGKGRPGEEDFHIAAWLAQVVDLCGGVTDPEQARISRSIYTLEKELGKGKIPRDVIKYWERWVERPSWREAFSGPNCI